MPERLDELRSALADRYRVERQLGSGGMATVYLAHDVRHDRRVAVKVLRPELAATIGVDRFLREIEIAARLTHPHILDLHDSGEANGLLFYVMPYLTGGSLRGRLDRRGTLERDEVLATVREVAEALDYAHRQGVIHRDIKPENILMSEGHAMVADFGIAKALSSLGGANLTRSGFPLGTPGYMSPEQAAGLTDLDEGTDVYGLGCVAYEMVVGEPPGLWPTEEASRLGRFVDAPPKHRERLDSLPGRWEQALVKALAMRRKDRFTSPLDFIAALDAASGHRRRYDAAKIREIIGRAAQAQAQVPTLESRLSFQAIEEVAAEVGVPVVHVRDAVHELAEGATGNATPALPSAADDEYSDAEVEAIIARAIELQDAELTTEDGSLTIGAVEQVAAEVGIPPERVRNALREMENRESIQPWLYGRPSVLVIDREVRGELREERRDAMLAAIRATFGTAGHTGTLGTALVWSDDSAAGAAAKAQVTITTQEGRTRIRLRRSLLDLGGEISGSAIGWISGGLAGVALVVGLGAGMTSAAPFVGIALAAVGAYAASRWYFVRQATERERQLDELADRLEQEVQTDTR